MKKILLCSVVIIATFCFISCKQDVSDHIVSDDSILLKMWVFERNDDDSYSIKKYKGEGSQSVVIPSVCKGKPVTGIVGSAFKDCSALKKITIPSSMTSISRFAFSGCSGLESIEVESDNSVYYSNGNCLIERASMTLVLGCRNSIIPEGVTVIGSQAFSGCSGLTEITIPSSVTTIGVGAFFGCNGLTEITMHEDVTSIGSSAFSGCSGLTSITMPKSVTSIGYFAFSGCRDLTSITISSSVTYIDRCAFQSCGLTSIKIPSSVTYIADDAFYLCNDCESIEVEEGNSTYYSEGNCLIRLDSKALFLGCKNSVIPSDVTGIMHDAFSYCNGLTEITIPSSVTCIKTCAFSSCSGLTSIAIPKSVTTIESHAFDGCSGLDNIVYSGTKTQWNSIERDSSWNNNTGNYTIHCTDGDIAKN